MTPNARISPRAWLAAIPILAALWIGWAWHQRDARVQYVSGLQGRANRVDARDASSPTGYPDGQRELIIPERNEESFQWISQAQQMLSRRELRVRSVDYENAPFGHAVTQTSPYRWWLGLVAVIDHRVSGRPLGLSVEDAARFADPLLQLLFLAGAAAAVWTRFGPVASALVSASIAGMFPVGAAFLPGAPAQLGLASILAFASAFGVCAALAPGGRLSLWLALGGIAGGLGAWVCLQLQVPVVLALACGCLLAVLLRGGSSGSIPWRAWSITGGATCAAAYLAENFPDRMGEWNSSAAPALFGFAWVGLGELLVLTQGTLVRRASGKATSGASILLACFVFAAAAAGIFSEFQRALPGKIPGWGRLAWLPDSPSAPSLGAWLKHDGLTLSAAATLLPALILAIGAWALLRRPAGQAWRPAVAAALLPAAAALGFATKQLAWWVPVDALLLVVLAAGSAALLGGPGRLAAWLPAAAVLAFAAPGFARMIPLSGGPGTTLTPQESEELVERHLAHWLERRTGVPGFVVFAPPGETTGISYFGGLRGVGTFAEDNKTGFGAALTIAGAQSMEDVQNDLQGRQVRYIILPSWDPFFDDFAKLYLVKELSGRRSLLADQLRHWVLPPWLRAVPYQLPVGGGFEGQSVLVFEVVDPQPPAAAAGRLAEYLVETGNLQGAQSMIVQLHRYPGDIGALAALAQVDAAAGDDAGAAGATRTLLARLAVGGDRYLAWDRRISLAVVLARAARYDLAAEQVRRCAADATQERIRSLSTGSLYDFLVLSKSFRIEIPGAGLRELAAALLPADLRDRL
ncbi:MAG TPA: hypothetical protein VGG37_02340 [Opitutaceae bacterium]|jgi:hypothetical protein